jgi:hypothetical protein
LSRICPELRPNPGLVSGPCARSNHPRATCTGATANGGRPGTRSSAFPTADGSRSASARRGPSAAVRLRATTPSARPRPGCARSSTRRAAGRCRGSCRDSSQASRAKTMSCFLAFQIGRAGRSGVCWIRPAGRSGHARGCSHHRIPVGELPD